MPSAPQERRKFRRFTLCLPILVTIPQDGQKSTHTRDVSSRSVCFYLDEPLPPSSTIDFLMTLPRELTQVEGIRMRCSGSVLRVDGASSGHTVAVTATIDNYDFVA